MGIYDFLMKYNLTYEQYIEMLYEIRSFLDFSDSTMEMLIKLSDLLYDDKEFKQIKPLYKDNKTTCDFCGCEIHGNEYDNDGETIMCKTCQESGKFGHYNTNKGQKQ